MEFVEKRRVPFRWWLQETVLSEYRLYFVACLMKLLKSTDNLSDDDSKKQYYLIFIRV